ncbi:hypothetical protein FRC00_006085 [Tulasnella sp. 408]|nr:hypothetical protein FRC00_006085 [Tulasnella sp. 408]
MGQPIYASQYPNPSPYVPQPYPGTSGFIQPGPFPGPASPPYLQQPPYPTQYGPSSYQYSPSATGRATPTSSFNPSSSATLATPTSSSNRRRRSPRPESLSQDDWTTFLDTGMMSYSPPSSRSRTSKTPEPSSSGTRAPSTYLPQNAVPGSTLPRSQSRAAFSSSPTPYQAAQSSTAYMGQQSLYQNPSYAPAGGSTGYPSAEGSTSYAPAGSSTSYAPAGSSTSYASPGGPTSYPSAEGSTSYAPARSSTSYALAGGSTSYVSAGGSTSYVLAEGSTSYSPVGGSTSYQALAAIPQQGPSNPYPLQPYGSSSIAGPSDPSRGTTTAGRGRQRRQTISGSATGTIRDRSASSTRGDELKQTLDNLARYCRCRKVTKKPHRHWKESCPANPNKIPRHYCQRDECLGGGGFVNQYNLDRHMEEVHGRKNRKKGSKEKE